MMTWSINLFILSIGFLIVGMFNPKLLLFWMDKPGRIPIIIFSVFLFMVGATMFGEANREKHIWLAEHTQQDTETKSDSVPSVTATLTEPIVTSKKKIEE